MTEAVGTVPPAGASEPDLQAPGSRWRLGNRSLLGLFAVTSMLTASLLFAVQPMVARMVLPAFGGSPQVWTTAMLFFQGALLLGYGYTHVATVRLRPDRQPLVHLGLLAVPLVLLPIALGVAPSGRGGAFPSLELLAALALGVAAPFVLIATSGPLLQRWFSWTDHPQAHDPYVLYAAGNIGSLAGLLTYPFLLEPNLSVTAQSRMWTGGYVLALVLVAACAVPAMRSRRRAGSASADQQQVRAEPSPPVGPRRAGRWILLAFVPSSTMLAATTYLSTDIAAVPLLWVLPLAVYLATFVVTFGRWGPAATRVATWLAVPIAVIAVAVRPGTAGVTFAVTIQIALVAAAGLVCHGRLAADRPPANQLTRFFVFLAVGGALGGFANGIVAPLLFPVVVEHGLIVAALAWIVARELRTPVPGTVSWQAPARVGAALAVALLPVLAFVAGVLPVPGGRWTSLGLLLVVSLALLSPVGRSGAVAGALTLLAVAPGAFQLAEAREVDRTFFGVHRVIDRGEIRVLMHGTTLHGNQDLSDDTSRRQATAYYASDGPLGDVIEVVAADRGDIGVLGLGAGAVAAYGIPGQRIVFHEIDPAMERIAREHFTFLDDSRAEVSVVLGDGRLTVAEVEGAYGLLVADAFSSDSIPVHLLTVEAIGTYLDALTDDGLVALHLSNRYLDLLPVAAGAADALDVGILVSRTPPDAERAAPSVWVVLGPDDGRLDDLRARGWEAPSGPLRPWTDQRSDLWSVVRR